MQRRYLQMRSLRRIDTEADNVCMSTLRTCYKVRLLLPSHLDYFDSLEKGVIDWRHVERFDSPNIKLSKVYVMLVRLVQ